MSFAINEFISHALRTWSLFLFVGELFFLSSSFRGILSTQQFDSVKIGIRFHA